MTAKILNAKLKALVEKHTKWLRGEYGGEYADLRHANLSHADLRDADLRHAKKSIKLNGICTRPFTHCSVLRLDHLPGIKMLAAAKRSSATSRKCRHSKAKVLGITNMDGILTRTAGMNARRYTLLHHSRRGCNVSELIIGTGTPHNKFR